VVDEARRYRQMGVRTDLPDLAYIDSMRQRLEDDWRRWRMTDAYPFIEDMLRDSYRQSVKQRRKFFDAVRANPQLCGYNLTGMLDHGLTGEGVWTFWREFKPGIADAMRDGWAPLRWCLFATPEHGYCGKPIHLEAVLANEDMLPPGAYPVTFRLNGPAGVVWEKRTKAVIARKKPLATPVLSETVRVGGPAGGYTLAASMENAAPAGDRLTVRLSRKDELPRLKCTLAAWGVGARATRWLAGRGVVCRPFSPKNAPSGDVLLLGQPRDTEPESHWHSLAAWTARGGTVIALSPRAFTQGDGLLHRLPLRDKPRLVGFWDWLYHRECVARSHPAISGLQGPGLLDWGIFGEVISHVMLQGGARPSEPIIAAFAVGYCKATGYDSGIVLGAYRHGKGRFILNALNILENVGRHPAADRLLLNLIAYGAGLRVCECTVR